MRAESVIGSTQYIFNMYQVLTLLILVTELRYAVMQPKFRDTSYFWWSLDDEKEVCWCWEYQVYTPRKS